MLVYLSLFVFLCLLTLIIAQNFFYPLHIQSDIRLAREAQIFYQQLEREVHGAESYFISDQKLHVINDEGTITFEQNGDVIFRRLNGAGNLLVAQFVAQVDFIEVNERVVKVQLRMQEDQHVYGVERLIGLRIEAANNEEVEPEDGDH